MIDITRLKTELDSFLKEVPQLACQDKELSNRVRYCITALYNAFREGGYIFEFEFTDTLDCLEELAENQGENFTYEHIIQGFPEIVKLISFYKRKVYRKPKYGGQ